MRRRLLLVLVGILVALSLGYAALAWYVHTYAGPAVIGVVEFAIERLEQILPRDRETIERVRRSLREKKAAEERGQ